MVSKGERLRYLRILYGLNQTQIGKSIGTSRNYISQLENEILPVSKEQYNRLVNAIYRIGEAKKQGRLKIVLEEITEELNNRK
ncbi:helix-turn-helix domain-containing protein [Paraclostridium bifermentans]|uniref:helix-turn-helix domain-containing protein n=1 Tax=Paraclostridium bifermentans TaxID=1490 RepID=UPI00189CA1CF|nr:helix-turn-helix transcriptional regulator [Paraclostridium bifermentans]